MGYCTNLNHLNPVGWMFSINMLRDWGLFTATPNPWQVGVFFGALDRVLCVEVAVFSRTSRRPKTLRCSETWVMADEWPPATNRWLGKLALKTSVGFKVVAPSNLRGSGYWTVNVQSHSLKTTTWDVTWVMIRIPAQTRRKTYLKGVYHGLVISFLDEIILLILRMGVPSGATMCYMDTLDRYAALWKTLRPVDTSGRSFVSDMVYDMASCFSSTTKKNRSLIHYYISTSMVIVLHI